MKNIILAGSPGAGKSTQIETLEAKELDFNFISVGKILREISRQDSPLARKIKETMSKGGLVDEFLVNQLVKDKLRGIDRNRPVILDGYPRSLGQLNFVDQMFTDKGLNLPILVYIKITQEEAIRRLSARRVCSECKTNFQVDDLAGKEKCEKCGGKLIQREDDKPEAIKNRFEIFEIQLELIKYYFKKRNRYYEIDGMKGKEEVGEELIKIIQRNE